MKTLVLIIPIMLVIGCSSFSNQVFRAEKTATDMVYGSVKAYNEFYRISTNGVTGEKLVSLNSSRDRVYSFSRNFSRVVTATENLRLAYETNSVQSNKTALLISLQTAQSQATNIVMVIKSMMHFSQ